MNKIIVLFLLVSFFACKKENNNIVNNNQEIDSIVYYNKWTKMNKVPNFIGEDITDVSYQPNKNIALLSNSRVYFIDSNFNIKTSPSFFNSLGNRNTKFQIYKDLPNTKNTFYYLTGAQSAPGQISQLVILNGISYYQGLDSYIYTRSFFIKDTNQNNLYTFLGYGHDYFAYNIYNYVVENKYLFNYQDKSRKIDTSISFNSNVSYNATFRLRDKIVFWKYFENEFTIINTKSMLVQTNQSISKDYTFIGTFNNYAYFYNFKGNGIFKTNNLLDFELVYEYKLISKILPFFDEKYLLIKRYKDTNDDTIIEELTLLNIENNTSKVLPLPFEKHEGIMCNWVIDNTLYILTSTNIYARKF